MLKLMQTAYYKKIDSTSLAVLDLVDYYGEGLIITRINVPKKHRGKGYASVLLKECIADADETKTTLFLEIQSSDGLSYEQLEAWYRRHGFKGFTMFKRRPKS